MEAYLAAACFRGQDVPLCDLPLFVRVVARSKMRAGGGVNCLIQEWCDNTQRYRADDRYMFGD